MKHLLLTTAAVFGLAGTAWASPVDIMTGRIEIQLRQAGLDPASAHWGAWAALHNPRSDCGIYANMISGQADMPSGLGGDASHSTESNVMVVERENLCTEAGAKKVPIAPKTPAPLKEPPVVTEIDPATGLPIGKPTTMHLLGSGNN
ncbi:hypothetical protein J3T99_05685 [Acetobacteraceae bacterium B3987]|nr:hypothetical protein [Acetobacteraceae bacterium B3987]